MSKNENGFKHENRSDIFKNVGQVNKKITFSQSCYHTVHYETEDNTKHQKILSSVGFMQEMFRMQMLDSKSRDCSWDHVGK